MLGFTITRSPSNWTSKRCVSFSETIIVYAQSRYTLLRVIGESKPLYISGVPSLRSLEFILVASNFVRASRSHFVNRWHVKSIESVDISPVHRRFYAVMCDGSKVAISRRCRRVVMALFRGAC